MKISLIDTPPLNKAKKILKKFPETSFPLEFQDNRKILKNNKKRRIIPNNIQIIIVQI